MLALAGQWESPPAPQFTAPRPCAAASQPAAVRKRRQASPQPVSAESPSQGCARHRLRCQPNQPRRPLPRARPPRPKPAPPRSGRPTPTCAPPLSGTASLQASISRLPGIGPSFSERLGKMGIRTIGDLLWLLPRRYDDYRAMKPIYQLRDGDEVTILANLWDLKSKRLPGRGASFTTGLLGDSTATIQVSWFNPYVLKQLKTGQSYVFSGKVQSYLGRLTMRNPEFEEPDKELLHTGRLVPVYPLTKGIGAKWMRNTQKRVVAEWGRRVHDHLPESVRQRAGLMTLAQALEQVHFPDDQESLQAARQRLAFDELFVIQIGVLRQRQEYRSLPGRSFPLDAAGQAAFVQALPFEYTGAQARAARAILDDLASDRPMSRLMQGDVGSGKTAVAANAMWAVAANGAQAAMMAPTEILAEQHFRGLEPPVRAADRAGASCARGAADRQRQGR